jgi:PII-like signaling protein
LCLGRHEMSEDALKLTTYFGERSRINGHLLADELLDIHARHEILSSILLRGVQGFGAKHHRRSDRLLTLSEDLPLVCVAIDVRERIEALLSEVGTIGHEGLLTLEHARLHGAPGALGKPTLTVGDIALAPTRSSSHRGQTLKLTVYLGRHDRANGSPAFLAACRCLYESGVAGATVLLGVDGTRHSERERARFFARNASVPLMMMSVGDEQQIVKAIDRLREILSGLLFTIERVRICKRDGVSIDPPHDESMATEYGMDVRQKLTVIVSEAAVYEKRSIYLELVRRLRAANAAGATSLRGIWGFHGNHAPHGDRLLTIRRHVPVVTEAIDTPERIAALYPIVDELTHKGGLVTSELVPASSAPPSLPGL